MKPKKMSKRMSSLLLALIMAVLLCACSGDDSSYSDDTGNSNNQSQLSNVPIVPDSSSTQSQQSNASTAPESNSTQSLFTTEYIPVASSQGYFIVRNQSGNLYGLVDSKGEFVLPCEFEKLSFYKAKSQTVLKVMSKGSYGVFDLNGEKLIPCEYTEIRFSPYYDSCIVKTFVNKYGLLDFNGNTILPIDFDVLQFGYGKIIAAAKNANEQETACVAAYSSDGKLIKNFAWDKGTILSIAVGNGGNLLSVYYSSPSTSYTVIENLTVEGEAIWGDTRVVGDYIFYFQDGNLNVRDINTQQEILVWSFPEGRNSRQSSITNDHIYVDPISNIEFVELSVVGVMDDAPHGERYYIRVILGEQIDTISCIGDVGNFYNGVAMVIPPSGYLYTINSKGEKLKEIRTPYTNCFLLRNAAVLNNQGFYSIIDFDGNMLLSEKGYSNVQKLNVRGIYLVTDQNGQLGLINEYAEELVPCGGITSIETAIKRPSNDAWKLESSLDAEDELYVIYKDNKWAVYSDSKCQLLTDFTELAGEHSSQHECILGNSGYALINEEADTAYLISYDGSSYEVFSYLDLT